MALTSVKKQIGFIGQGNRFKINGYKEAPMAPIFRYVLYYKQGTAPESRLKGFIVPEELLVHTSLIAC